MIFMGNDGKYESSGYPTTEISLFVIAAQSDVKFAGKPVPLIVFITHHPSKK